MAFHKIPLKAGVEHTLMSLGRALLLDDLGAAPALDVVLLLDGSATTLPARKQNFRYVAPFDAVLLTSPVDAMVTVITSMDQIAAGPGATRVSSSASDPVFVSFSQQVVPLGSVTVNNADAQAVPVRQVAGQVLEVRENRADTVLDLAPVAVGVARGALVSDPAMKRLRFRNSHSSAIVAIGGAGVTLANGVIQLEPGAVWVEDTAPGAAWYAISDTPNTNVQIQGLK